MNRFSSQAVSILAPRACLILAFCATACGGVTLEPVHSSVQRPSNVAVYLAVEDGGEPVTGLSASNFHIEEDDVRLDPSETRLTLLDRSTVAVHHTLVLVDLGGKLDEQERKTLARGIGHLVEKLRPVQGLTILGFDGGRRLHPLGEFPATAQVGTPELGSILRFRSRDESRNLNGAVIEALRRLDDRLKRTNKPVRVGTLVVFTRGDDLAGHVSEQELEEALAATRHELYALGIEGRESRQLDRIGRAGVQRSPSESSVAIAFEELASRLNKAWEKYYLVQYCSPARSGIRKVSFVVEYENSDGKDAGGSVDLELDADPFSGGCDPKARPRFVTALSEPGALKAQRAEAGSSTGRGTGAGSGASQPASPAGGAGADEAIVAPPPSDDYAD